MEISDAKKQKYMQNSTTLNFIRLCLLWIAQKRLWIYLRDTVMYMYIQQLLIIQKLLKCVNNSLINLA